MTIEELNAVKKFKNNLLECFDSHFKQDKQTWNYLQKVIALHYELAELDFQRSAMEQEQEYEETQRRLRESELCLKK